MTDPQGQPDHEPAAAPEPVEPAAPPAPAESDRPAAPPAKKAAKKAPAKAAKKAPAKKAPAKKAPAKKAPVKAAEVKKAPGLAPAPKPVATNGSGRLADGAKETAARAKSMVDAARNPLAPAPSPSKSASGPLLAAGILALFGLLLIRRLLSTRRG